MSGVFRALARHFVFVATLKKEGVNVAEEIKDKEDVIEDQNDSIEDKEDVIEDQNDTTEDKEDVIEDQNDSIEGREDATLNRLEEIAQQMESMRGDIKRISNVVNTFIDGGAVITENDAGDSGAGADMDDGDDGFIPIEELDLTI